MVLELKTIPRRYPAIATKTIELVRSFGMASETLLTSCDHVLSEIRPQDHEIATEVLTAERLHRSGEYVQGLGASAFEAGCTGAADVIRRGVSADDIDTEMLHDVTRAGLMVNVWTENSASRVAALIDAG